MNCHGKEESTNFGSGSSQLLLLDASPLIIRILYHLTYIARHLVTSLLALLSLFRILLTIFHAAISSPTSFPATTPMRATS